MMKFEATLGRIFLAVISVLVTVLGVDTISTWFISPRSPIEQDFPVGLVRRPQPYTMFGGTADAAIETAEATVHLNSLGYPGAAPARVKPANEYRIFVLGGSTVFLGEPPIPVLLEEAFHQNGAQHVKVYNFGVISSVSGMELARIVFEISELEPDLIMMYNGGNDLLSPFRQDPRPGYPLNFIVYEHNPLLESEVRSYPTGALLAYGSNIARTLFPNYFSRRFANLEQLRADIGWGSDAWKAEIARIYVENLVKADKVSLAFGADFIAFAQPMVYFKDEVAPEEEAQAFHGERRPYVLEMRERVRQEVEKQRELNNHLKVIDLTDIYDTTPDWVFTDSIHTQQASKSVVVQEMYKYIMHYFNERIAETRPRES
ncbi:MAG TPA: hypothetical protein VGD99_21240 [Anaerolineae bacterium]|jgi:hypothetical protein